MRIAIVKPPHLGSLLRGVGFYTDRLFEGFRKIPNLDANLITFSHSPTRYLPYDLVHFPYFDLFYLTFPPIRLRKTVVTLHDVTPLKFPEHFPLGVRGKNVWSIQKMLLQTADAVLTDSISSKNDIWEQSRVPKDKIFVTYLAADAEFRQVNNTSILDSVKAKYRLPDRFVLYVGGVNWNKNLLSLVKACQQANVNLVLVGKEFLNERVNFSHPELQPFKEVLQLVQDDQRIQRLGFVSTADLAAIYNLAAVYVQPSVYEGFGLPVLEAMSCGTPVICGKNSSLPEIASAAAVYANISDPSDLALKILKVLKLPKLEREKIRKGSMAQAAKFSWEKTSRQTREIYQKVLEGM